MSEPTHSAERKDDQVPPPNGPAARDDPLDELVCGPVSPGNNHIELLSVLCGPKQLDADISSMKRGICQVDLGLYVQSVQQRHNMFIHD